MTFADKQKRILDKLCETNYSSFDGNKEKALDFVETHMLTIFGFTPDMTRLYIRETVRDIDLTAAKNENISKAVISINALNDLCRDLGLEPFVDADTTNAEATSRLIGKMASQIFNAGINKH